MGVACTVQVVRVTVKLAFLVPSFFLAGLSLTLKEEQRSAITEIFKGQSRSVCLRAMVKARLCYYNLVSEESSTLLFFLLSWKPRSNY